MTSPDSFVSPTGWQFEESAHDVLISGFHEHFSPSSLGSGSHYPDMSPYSTPVDQADFDLVGLQDHTSAFLTSDLSFDPNTADATFTPLDLTQGRIPRISPGLDHDLGRIFDGDPVTINVPQTSDEVPWCSVPLSFDPPSISYTTNHSPLTSSMSQDMKESFQTTVGPFTLVGIRPPGWGIGQQEAGFSTQDSPTFNLADPVVGIDVSSYPGENIQLVDTEAVQSLLYIDTPLEEQLILSEEPVGDCEWQDDDGTVCGNILTRGTLPGHLSKHGVKNKPRNDRTKCKWVGCKKTINRESVARHIREVHLRLGRPSKGQHPYL